MHVVEGDVLPAGPQRDRPVHSPRVDVGESKFRGDTARERALARARGTVNRHHGGSLMHCGL